MRKASRNQKNVLGSNMSKKDLKITVLAQMLTLIRENPGIRPRELNRLLKRDHTAIVRQALIKQGLVKKVKKRAGTYYYPIPQKK